MTSLSCLPRPDLRDGFPAAVLFILAYVYIDILSPQRLTYTLLNTVPVSLIAVVIAVGGWTLVTTRAGSRSRRVSC